MPAEWDQLPEPVARKHDLVDVAHVDAHVLQLGRHGPGGVAAVCVGRLEDEAHRHAPVYRQPQGVVDAVVAEGVHGDVDRVFGGVDQLDYAGEVAVLVGLRRKDHLGGRGVPAAVRNRRHHLLEGPFAHVVNVVQFLGVVEVVVVPGSGDSVRAVTVRDDVLACPRVHAEILHDLVGDVRIVHPGQRLTNLTLAEVSVRLAVRRSLVELAVRRLIPAAGGQGQG